MAILFLVVVVTVFTVALLVVTGMEILCGLVNGDLE